MLYLLTPLSPFSRASPSAVTVAKLDIFLVCCWRFASNTLLAEGKRQKRVGNAEGTFPVALLDPAVECSRSSFRPLLIFSVDERAGRG